MALSFLGPDPVQKHLTRRFLQPVFLSAPWCWQHIVKVAYHLPCCLFLEKAFEDFRRILYVEVFLRHKGPVHL